MDEKKERKEIETPIFIKKPHTFILKKLSFSTSNKNLIKSQISQYFNSPEKYFNPNSKIFVNRNINIKKIIPTEDTKTNKSLGKKNTYINYSKISHHKEKDINRLTSEHQISEKNYEIIDEERLKSLFISFKKSSKNIRRKNSLETIPKQLSIDLSKQNLRLRSKKYIDKKSRETSKYLSRKLKKNESDLLFNSIDLYRYKKEILGKEEKKEDYNSINSQSCLFKWTSSLRKPPNFYGKRETYINVGGENNPLWSIVVEKYPIMKEYVVKSGYNLDNKDYKDFTKKNVNNTEIIKKVENMDEISIEGKNLYNLEFKREMNNNKNRILHNVFIENGKAILYKDVNYIFGHKTIFKNYSRRNIKRFNKISLSNGNKIRLFK